MKKNLFIIYSFFGASISILIVLSYLTSLQIHSLVKYNQQINVTDKVKNLLSEIELQLVLAESSQRGYLIKKDSSYLADYMQTPKIIYPLFDSLKKVVPDKKHQQDVIIIKNTAVMRLGILQSTLDDKILLNEFQQSVESGNKMMQEFKELTAAFQKEQDELLIISEANKRQYELAAPAYLRLIFFITIVFLVASFIIIVREFKRRFKYQQDLEKKIQELNMSHTELEQIAFIASHDLQEPLRKMRTFGGKLLLQYKDQMNEAARTMLSRIDYSARRMQGLIEDIVDYTSLINSSEEKSKVDLNTCILDVEEDLKNLITNRNVELVVEALPEIEGYPYQLKLLYTNLIHNSIKFCQPGQKTVIKINHQIIEGEAKSELPEKSNTEKFIKVSIKDNGIGFENEFARKIFVIFQRLHNQSSAYAGKGIGLSICKRVMTNHNGFITAEGTPGEGATFHLYFPVN